MTDLIHLFDVVALRRADPRLGLQEGEEGTFVEDLGGGVFEVEFSDDAGRTYALEPLRADQLVIVHRHSPPDVPE